MIATTLHGPRVLLRPWVDDDLAPFAAMNADPEVMRWFKAPLAREESDAMAARIRQRLDADGYGLWALQTPELRFAGFVGLFPALAFELPFDGYAGTTPLEIGWRLARAAWGHGDATEAAQLSLENLVEPIIVPDGGQDRRIGR